MKIKPQDHPDYVGGWVWRELEIQWIEELITKVVAAEREACAKVCDELHWPWRMGDNSGPKECAASIRARGKK